MTVKVHGPSQPLVWRPPTTPGRPLPELPLIDAGDLIAPLPGDVIWDHWPVQAADGSIVRDAADLRVADEVRLTMTIENVPSLENPRTGKITPLSILACLRGLTSTLKVGS
jgi:hypothetical protein